MDISNIKEYILNEKGIIKSNKLNEIGICNEQIKRLCKKGILVKIKRGYYIFEKEDNDCSEEQRIKKLYPDGIICMESALYYYGYSDRTPLDWSIAFNRAVSRSRLENKYPVIRPYYWSKQIYDTGITEININGIQMKIYEKERVICDCFRYRNKMDAETFNKAIRAFVADDKKNMKKLSEYARKLRVYKKVQEVIGVWM